MKKLLVIFTSALLGLTVSCTTYNDSQVWDAINDLEQDVTDLQTLLNALSNNLTIKSIIETKDGYLVTFSDKSSITINNNNNTTDSTCVIEAVDWNDSEVTFTLSDGSMVTIPRTAAGSIDNNKRIYYMSSNGGKIIPNFPSYTDAVLQSNIVKNGLGCMVFDDVVTQLDRWFNNQPTLSKVVISNEILVLNETFVGCTGLVDVTIPENVVLMNSAFEGCSNLRYIYCKPQTPPAPIGTEVLGTIPTDVIIYVPSASVAKYKAAAGWSNYADNIVGCDFKDITTNYNRWIGSWTVSGSGLGWKDGEGYVTPKNVSFNITISNLLEESIFTIDGWNGQNYQLNTSYVAAQDAFYISGQTVAKNVTLHDGSLASEIILAGLDANGRIYTNYDMICVSRSGNRVVATPVTYLLQDGSEFNFTCVAFLAIIDGQSYFITNDVPGTSLTLTPTSSNRTSAQGAEAVNLHLLKQPEFCK